MGPAAARKPVGIVSAVGGGKENPVESCVFEAA